MDLHQEIDEFREQYGVMPREQFLSRFREPFLVVEMRAWREDPRDFRTLAATSAERPTIAESRKDGALIVVYVAIVDKTDRNIFNNMITLGRATNNDIYVNHGSVSKFHAFFKKDPSSGAMAVWDAGSRFGTTINAAPIKPGAGIPIQSGDTVIFARAVSATFYSPEDFFEYLRLPRKTHRK